MTKSNSPFFVRRMADFLGDAPVSLVAKLNVDRGDLEIFRCRDEGHDVHAVGLTNPKSGACEWYGTHSFTPDTAHEDFATGETVGGVPLIFDGHGKSRLDHDGRGARHALTVLYPRCWRERSPKADAA